MWWVEKYDSNESERLFKDSVDPHSEACINFFEKNKEYRNDLYKNMASETTESLIANLIRSNEKTRVDNEESSKLLAELFPGMVESWHVDNDNGKLPGMNRDWGNEVAALNDPNRTFIRGPGTSNIKIGDIDTPHDVDNSNQIEQVDLT